MTEVIIVAIWDKTNDVYSRPVQVTNKTKELKYKGRKPNKIIMPESLTDKVILRRIKNIGSYDCKIVKAIGK
jgi:pectin methylesterase-like acyl-CoA thioesterase